MQWRWVVVALLHTVRQVESNKILGGRIGENSLNFLEGKWRTLFSSTPSSNLISLNFGPLKGLLWWNSTFQEPLRSNSMFPELQRNKNTGRDFLNRSEYWGPILGLPLPPLYDRPDIQWRDHRERVSEILFEDSAKKECKQSPGEATCFQMHASVSKLFGGSLALIVPLRSTSTKKSQTGAQSPSFFLSWKRPGEKLTHATQFFWASSHQRALLSSFQEDAE